MKTNVHFWSYLAQLILELEVFHTKFVEENQNTSPVQYTPPPKKLQFMT